MGFITLVLLVVALYLAWRRERTTKTLEDTDAFLRIARNELEKTERAQRVRARFDAEAA